jgi:hypothetical protein
MPLTMFLWPGGRYVNNANVQMATVGVNYCSIGAPSINLRRDIDASERVTSNQQAVE